ncbi:hypothetical protein TruAng_000989 [Truncatella angustata]|nr:hypothetical protein TruAng_000989 [Truncatella angustata]
MTLQDGEEVELRPTVHPLKIFDLAKSQGRYVFACAPMLAFRQVVHHYGTDLCWTPMILAKEFNRSSIARDSDLTVSTSSGNGNGEGQQQQWQQQQPLTIVQFGANSPLELSRAASLAAPYVSGVDLNCGCPQSWACSETLGAALMERRELVRELVTETRARLRSDGWAVDLEASADDPRGRSVSVKIRRRRAPQHRLADDPRADAEHAVERGGQRRGAGDPDREVRAGRADPGQRGRVHARHAAIYEPSRGVADIHFFFRRRIWTEGDDDDDEQESAEHTQPARSHVGTCTSGQPGALRGARNMSLGGRGPVPGEGGEGAAALEAGRAPPGRDDGARVWARQESAAEQEGEDEAGRVLKLDRRAGNAGGAQERQGVNEHSCHEMVIIERKNTEHNYLRDGINHMFATYRSTEIPGTRAVLATLGQTDGKDVALGLLR